MIKMIQRELSKYKRIRFIIPPNWVEYEYPEELGNNEWKDYSFKKSVVHSSLAIFVFVFIIAVISLALK